MSEFFKAELKDRFLGYALEQDDFFQTQLLYDEFLRPNYSIGYVEQLIKEIIDHEPGLLDIMSGNGIKIFKLLATDLTEDFLEEGGFTHLYVKEEEKWDAFSEQLSDSMKLTREEKINLGKTNTAPQKKERVLLKVLIAAVTISFLFTIFSIFKELFSEEDYVTKDELNKALEKIQSKESVKNDLLKETSLLSTKDTIEKPIDSTVNSDIQAMDNGQ